MTANNHFRPPQAGAGFPFPAKQAGSAGDKAIRYYRDIFQLPLKHRDPLQDRSQAFWLSFEDDFDHDPDEGFYQDDYYDDDVYLPGEDIIKEDSLFDEEDGQGPGFRNELFYK